MPFSILNWHCPECHSRQSEYTLAIESLAEAAGMSRSAFAARLRATRTNTAGICNWVADAEGDAATRTRDKNS